MMGPFLIFSNISAFADFFEAATPVNEFKHISASLVSCSCWMYILQITDGVSLRYVAPKSDTGVLTKETRNEV
jgi:hypothetical protein